MNSPHGVVSAWKERDLGNVEVVGQSGEGGVEGHDSHLVLLLGARAKMRCIARCEHTRSACAYAVVSVPPLSSTVASSTATDPNFDFVLRLACHISNTVTRVLMALYFSSSNSMLTNFVLLFSFFMCFVYPISFKSSCLWACARCGYLFHIHHRSLLTSSDWWWPDRNLTFHGSFPIYLAYFTHIYISIWCLIAKKMFNFHVKWIVVVSI